MKITPSSDRCAPWPIRPRPEPDELTSSWIARVIFSNGLSIQRFGKLLQTRALAYRDLDVEIGGQLADVLISATGISAEELRRTQLAAFAGTLWKTASVGHHPAWILWRDAWKSFGKFGLQYCPECLASDVRPYFRRWWRLSLAVSCPIHARYLLDRCWRCGLSVALQRGDEEQRPFGTIARCHACDTLLAKAPSHLGSDDAIGASLHRYQRALHEGLHSGHMWIAPGTSVRTLLFLPALRHLINLLAGHTDTKHFVPVVRASCGLEATTVEEAAPFDGLDNPARRERLFVASWLLDEWPSRFVTACQAAEVGAAVFSCVRPLWFRKVVRTRLLKWRRWRKSQPVHFRKREDYVRKYYGSSPMGFKRFTERVNFARSRLALWNDALALGRELQKAGLYTAKGLSRRKLVRQTRRIIGAARQDLPMENLWLQLVGRNKNNDFAAFEKRLAFVRSYRSDWDDPSALFCKMQKAGLYSAWCCRGVDKASRLVELAKTDSPVRDLFLVHCGSAASRAKAKGAAKINRNTSK